MSKTMDSCLIAIIDEGIWENTFCTGLLQYNVEITPESNIRDRENTHSVTTFHGSICAGIIKQYLPNAQFASIKILNESASAQADQLINALEWCSMKGIRLVNLSLGTIHPQDFPGIEQIVRHVVEEGMIIIAAANNHGYLTYPAALPNVIGVKQDQTGELEEGEYLYHIAPFDGVDLTIASPLTLINDQGQSIPVGRSNSIAAPVVTALVGNKLTENPQLTAADLREILQKQAKNYGSNQQLVDHHKLEIFNLRTGFRIWRPVPHTEVCVAANHPSDDCSTPLIGVFDCTGHQLDLVLDHLSRRFRDDRFNPLILNDSSAKTMSQAGQEFLYDIEYLSWRNALHSGLLPLLCQDYQYLYDPGIFIFGTKIGDQDGEFYRKLLRTLELDLCIFITEDVSKVQHYMDDSAGSKVILFGGEDHDAPGRDEQVIHGWTEPSYGQLYETIINLYQNQDITPQQNELFSETCSEC